jgi:hypothetical protein
MSTSNERAAGRVRRIKLPRWLIIVAGTLIVIVGAGSVALKLIFPPEKLRAMVVPRIEERVGSEVELSAIRLKVFPRIAVRLSDFAIANPPGFGAEPALRLEALDLEVRFWPLLRKQIELRQLRLVRPEIRYEVLADGTSNLSRLGPEREAEVSETEGAPSGTAAAAGAFVVSDLVLRDGSVFYSDAASGRVAWLNLDARLEAARAADGRALEGSGSVDLSAIRLLRPLQGEDTLVIPDTRVEYALFVDLPGDSLALPGLQVAAAGVTASGGGVVRGLMHERSVDLELESGEVGIAEILAELPAALRPQTVAADGRASLALRVAGPIGAGVKPQVKGTIGLAELSASYGEYGELLTGGSGQVTFTRESLALPSFNGNLYGRPFELRLEVSDFENRQVDGRVRGEVDLARMAELREGGAPMAGVARFNIAFAGPASEPQRLRMTGPIELSAVSYQNEKLAVPARISSATVRLTGTGVTAEAIPVRLGGSDLDISFSGARLLEYAMGRGESDIVPRVEFAVSSQRLDLSEIMVSDTTQPGYSDMLTARLAGKQLDGQDPAALARERYALPPIPPVVADGRVRIGEFLNPPTRAENVSFAVAVRDGVLEVRNLDGRLYGGQLSGGLRLDFSQGHPPFTLTYDLQLGQGRAGDFVSRWTRLGQAMTGLVDFNISGSAAIDESLLPMPDAIDAGGRTSFTRGNFQNFTLVNALAQQLRLDPSRMSGFQTLGGAYQIEGGNFVVQDWRFDGADLKGGVAGLAGLGGVLDLQLDLELPIETLQRAGLVQGGDALSNVLGQLAGQDQVINVALGIGGTMTRPELQLDSEALQAELAKRLEGQGQDLLRRLFRRQD